MLKDSFRYKHSETEGANAVASTARGLFHKSFTSYKLQVTSIVPEFTSIPIFCSTKISLVLVK